jgi:hypothetical protein
MSRFRTSNSRSIEYARLACVVSLLGVALAGCGGGSSDGAAPPPVSPDPPPTLPPPVQPSDPPALPPQAATAINLNDNHTVGVAHWGEGNTGDGGQGQTVAGLDCEPSMDETYHVHTHVSIYMNGEALAVPAEIGIVETSATAHCYYNIHTHDLSGKIHVEAPAPGVFTLGQLFAIWGQPLETTNVGGITGMPIVVYVTDNGIVTKETGDWHNIELKSHREVTIQIGTAITEIPNFTWSSN